MYEMLLKVKNNLDGRILEMQVSIDIIKLIFNLIVSFSRAVFKTESKFDRRTVRYKLKYNEILFEHQDLTTVLAHHPFHAIHLLEKIICFYIIYVISR